MIINADILSWAAAYGGPLFHAALMDAPYEMEFMGKGWDNSGIAFNPETWRSIARCLHPGAFLFVFAGTINDDLISVAMRQAGLRKYHKSLAWGYGSGFPKATDLPAQIDEDAFQHWLADHEEAHAIIVEYRAAVQAARKAYKAGEALRSAVNAAHTAYRAKRQEIKAAAGFLKVNGTRRHQPKFAAKDFGYREKDNGYNSKERGTFDVTTPATDMAQTWDGYSYGGQLLKPAVETILIFQKPYQGRAVDCITRTGAGALWIDGGRIGTDEIVDEQYEAYKGTRGIYNEYGMALRHNGNGTSHPAGRWPANLLLVHDPRCNGTCHPDCAVRRLGEQSGESEATRSIRVDQNTRPGYEGGWQPLAIERGHDDSGTAARFFYQADWMLERLEQADPLFYCAKSSRGERENGLAPEQIQLLRELYGLEDGKTFDEDTIQRGEMTRRNIHPTIKPISLAIYLSTLLLPPAMYAPRRLLIPFCGVASEYIGAMFAGFEEIVGVELEADHVAIANARVAWWQTMMRQTHSSDPRAILKAYGMKDKAKPDLTARWPAGSLFESLEAE